MQIRGWLAAALAVGAVLGAGRFVQPVAAQQMGDFDRQETHAKVKDFIVYASELQTAVAGRRSVLELNFQRRGVTLDISAPGRMVKRQAKQPHDCHAMKSRR